MEASKNKGVGDHGHVAEVQHYPPKLEEEGEVERRMGSERKILVDKFLNKIEDNLLPPTEEDIQEMSSFFEEHNLKLYLYSLTKTHSVEEQLFDRGSKRPVWSASAMMQAQLMVNVPESEINVIDDIESTHSIHSLPSLNGDLTKDIFNLEDSVSWLYDHNFRPFESEDLFDLNQSTPQESTDTAQSSTSDYSPPSSDTDITLQIEPEVTTVVQGASDCSTSERNFLIKRLQLIREVGHNELLDCPYHGCKSKLLPLAFDRHMNHHKKEIQERIEEQKKLNLEKSEKLEPNRCPVSGCNTLLKSDLLRHIRAHFDLDLVFCPCSAPISRPEPYMIYRHFSEVAKANAKAQQKRRKLPHEGHAIIDKYQLREEYKEEKRKEKERKEREKAEKKKKIKTSKKRSSGGDNDEMDRGEGPSKRIKN